ncbi:hypothetical protein BC832DRAFT_593638 [Gaertneriomyces semiglobifer]|nr:hypothetical protein BC832DRAFT_593638 [Gaertneriomyces semiglobifer]
MRFIRQATHLSARAARRAASKPSSASFLRPTPTPLSPTARVLASLNRASAISALHTSASVSNALESLKNGESIEGAGGVGVLGLAEDAAGEDEESHGVRQIRHRKWIAPDLLDVAVQGVVERHVTCSQPGQWKDVHFADPSLKFKIMKATVEATGRHFTSLDVTNVLTVGDLLKVLWSKTRTDNLNPRDPYANVDSVEEMFKSGKMPRNVYFVKPGQNTDIVEGRDTIEKVAPVNL